jgi:hypothetical protein
MRYSRCRPRRSSRRSNASPRANSRRPSASQPRTSLAPISTSTTNSPTSGSSTRGATAPTAWCLPTSGTRGSAALHRRGQRIDAGCTARRILLVPGAPDGEHGRPGGRIPTEEPGRADHRVPLPQMLSPKVTPAEMLEAWVRRVDVKNLYPRKLGQPYTDPDTQPVTLAHLRADCALRCDGAGEHSAKVRDGGCSVSLRGKDPLSRLSPSTDFGRVSGAGVLVSNINRGFATGALQHSQHPMASACHLPAKALRFSTVPLKRFRSPVQCSRPIFDPNRPSVNCQNVHVDQGDGTFGVSLPPYCAIQSG